MPNLWDADFEVDEAYAARRIETRFPRLAPISIELFGAGWDNIAYLINREFVFRFPRRTVALRLLENEIRCLGLIAPRVPARVPYPEFVGDSAEGGARPFAGYRLIPGTTACRANLSDDERTRLAVPLAQFLAALHAIPADVSFPSDELDRADIAGRAARVIDTLRLVAPLVPDIDIASLIAAIEQLAKTPPALPADLRLLHGDLYARHIVVDVSRGLAGIIDWGDVHLGDPALDLSIAFSFLPLTARPDFRAAYGSIDDATWDRARFRAIHYGALLTHFGADISDDAIRAAGEYALRACL